MEAADRPPRALAERTMTNLVERAAAWRDGEAADPLRMVDRRAVADAAEALSLIHI